MKDFNRREFIRAAGGFGLAAAYGVGGNPRIVDYSGYLANDFPRVKRQSTELAIVHCTATNFYFDLLNTFLSIRALSSPEKNSHYYINRRGVIYRLVSEECLIPN